MSNNNEVSKTITNPNTNPETEGRIHPDFPNYPIFTEPLPPRGSGLKKKNNPDPNLYVDKHENICVEGVENDECIKDVLKRFGLDETLTVNMSGGTPSSLGDEGSYEVSTLEITENDLIKLDGNSLLSEYINTKSRFLQGTKQFYFIDGFSSPILEKKINKIRKFHSL